MTTSWDNTATLFQDYNTQTYTEPVSKSRDGRQGYKGIYEHFSGPNDVYHMATKSEIYLQELSYQRQMRNCNFEKYVIMHKEQYQILCILEYHGYKTIDENSKMR